MDQQDPNLFKEQVVEMIAEGNTEKEEESQVEESSGEDQLIPRPAFQIDLNNENLTEEEKDAMVYLLSVRNQKHSLIFEKKQIITQKSQVSISLQQRPVQQKPLPKVETVQNGNQESQQELIQSKISQWKNELVANWRCVVANLQYIHKHKKPENLFRQKINEEMLFSIPQANKVSLNKWLTLPQIQILIIDFSNFYLEILAQNHSQQKKKINYHVWIYSLLALHQSYASYTNFEALGSVNACIDRQFNNKMKGAFQYDSEKNHSLENDTIQWLTTLLVLKQAFKQTFLGKYLILLKQVKII